MVHFHKLTIKEIVKETANAVTISFSIPEHLNEVFTFKAGQYITIKTIINGEELRRDYSLCVDAKSREFKVAVKAVENGTFSMYANNDLKIGDVLEVSEPNGRFIFTPDDLQSRTIVAFAAGSGITPIMSIIKTLLKQEPSSKFILIYGNKTPKDTIFYNELLALQSQFENRLDIHFVFSQSNIEGSLFGRIETSTVNYIIKNKYKDVVIDAFYLCGPEAMTKNVNSILNENGIENDVIFYELFTTPVSDTTENTTISEGKTQITILVDEEESTFLMSQKDSVLDAALAQKIDAPYSCQGGICSSCLARITEGKATMRQNNILTENELAEGLVLTCQAHPTTPTIIVDYDDV
ncbi:ferredoxin--NADP reductase [Flavobacteriaceae bacterium AU392]|nr:flavodoxin reductase [Flavobacteriaceae bacterium]RKM84887.1 ferredoxin--NADP reductase [Flavobacteriaceae bacterium AU392]